MLNLILTLSLAGSVAVAVVPLIPIAPGVYMPQIGEGSCCGAYDIASWLANNGTHIDTSCDYGSQGNIATAIRASGIPREKLWITSKINVESCGEYNTVAKAVQDQVLTPLGMNYVDLLLLHHAGRFEKDTNPRPPCFNASLANANGTYYNCRIQTWGAFQQLRSKGMAKAIGVSNFEIRDLQQIYDVYHEYPSVNQIEHHPYWHTDDIINFCDQNGITVTGYAPMGAYPRAHPLDDPAVQKIAQARNLTTGQVVLRYDLQKLNDRHIVIPRSQTSAHQKQNLDILSFVLTGPEMASLDKLPQNKVYNTNCQPWC